MRVDNFPTPFVAAAPVIAATIDLAEDCNLGCDYCFTGEKAGRKHISLDQFKKSVDWILSQAVSANAGKIELYFFGGEPMLHFDDIIVPGVEYGREAAKKANKTIDFGITTNGTLVEERVAEFFAKNNIGMLLSWDGDEESQNKHRTYLDGSGSHADILRNVPGIVKHLPKTTMRITLSKDNVQNLFHDVEFAWKQGFQSIAVTPVQEYEWSAEERAELEKQYKAVADWYVKLWRKGKRPFVKFLDDYVGYILFPAQGRHPCGAGRSYVGITVDGYVYPCHRFHDMGSKVAHEHARWSIGSIEEGAFDIGTRLKFTQFPLLLHAEGRCPECRYFKAGVCWGNCYAVNRATNPAQDIFTQPNISCYLVELGTRYGVYVLDKLMKCNAYMQAKYALRDGGAGSCGQGDTCQACHLFSNADCNRGEPNTEHVEVSAKLLEERLGTVKKQLKAFRRVDAGETVTDIRPLPPLNPSRGGQGGCSGGGCAPNPIPHVVRTEKKVDIVAQMVEQLSTQTTEQVGELRSMTLDLFEMLLNQLRGTEEAPDATQPR